MFLLQLQLDSTLSEEVLYFVLISCPLQNSSFLRYIMHAINTNWSMSNLESRISAGTTVSIIFTKKKHARDLRSFGWEESFLTQFPLQFYLTVEGYLLKQFFQCWIKTVIFEWQYWTLNVVLNMIGLRLEHSPINRIIRNTSFFLPRMMPLNTERKVFWKKLLL